MEIYGIPLLRTNISIREAEASSTIFNMTMEDIQNDNRICDIVTLSDDNESLITFQNIDVERDERYCYIHLKEYIGRDGKTKAVIIKKFVIEETFIEVDFIRSILNIILRQYNNQHPNRICIGHKSYRINHDFDKCILEIATDLVDLYFEFTNNTVRSYYLNDIELSL